MQQRQRSTPISSGNVFAPAIYPEDHLPFLRAGIYGLLSELLR